MARSSAGAGKRPAAAVGGDQNMEPIAGRAEPVCDGGPGYGDGPADQGLAGFQRRLRQDGVPGAQGVPPILLRSP
ncbi:hypothetical protein OTB20_17685 [Streptomyces sp. H27-H1]|uniref:hypothetical protein n=1 Tax=Streptomyces sp. H27-H1 TaxID=2996461 RepID=UPI00226F1B63|nr:hypothetical protein [Streptomyces sp. H27-H1]MCY0927997.1 hypothetical protein [Streptomyces sp. H27-H1]